MEPSAYDIAERADHLEVRGLSRDELAAALDAVELIRSVQADNVEAIRADLLKVLMSRGVSLNPPASLTQVQQLATHRAGLLATPVFTHETLSELRGDSSLSSTRTWLARRRDAHALFTVNYNGRTVIPAFQFDERGEARPELQPILSVLGEAGIHGWSLWTWLTKPTSYLSGGVPEEIARTDPERALYAARRFAAGPIA